MFSKDKRFSYKAGAPSNYINSHCFSLRYKKNNEGLHCAVVVGKKVDKKAVVRHTLKRRFLHALKELLHDKEVSYDLVFFLNRKSIEKKFEELQDEIKSALQRLEII